MDNSRITKEEMLALMERYQVSFPKEYIFYLTETKETLKGKSVHIQDGQWETDALMHGFYNTAAELKEAMEMPEEDWWPKGYIAIGYDEGGEYFCISTKEENFGSIFYFLSDGIDEKPEDALIKVCDGFLWLLGDESLDKISVDECSELFSECAYKCSRDALKYLYRDLFEECDKDLDKFFNRVEEKKNVKGRVVESGKIYELIFTSCDCPIHTEAGIKSNRLCECSRQSMICVFKDLVPERKFHIECVKSILSGNEECCHRIIFED